jgi:LysR family cys regulon transcriptional activator
VIDDVADIGIATESLAAYDDLITLPCYEWQHVLVMPTGHALSLKAHVTLEDIAKEDLITYHPAYTGRTRIDSAFATRKLSPRVALEAIDSDVIKTYVRLGLGVGIAAEMAVRDVQDSKGASDLCVRPVGHLFGQNVSRVAFKRGAYLRQFVYHFAELLSPRLDRKLVTQAMTGQANDYEL